MKLIERADQMINLDQYNEINEYHECGTHFLFPRVKTQKVLRMLIKRYDDIRVPEELQWCNSLIQAAIFEQSKLGIRHPFCYLTIRHGLTEYKKDDEWHVDGFSLKYSHLPEQNYIWTNKYPTQVITQPFNIPQDFDARVHNIHEYFQDNVDENLIETLKPNVMYCMDPYNIHRRDPSARGKHRTFVRISFTPIEIDDVNNTKNPTLPTFYTRDGIKDFRQHLIRYQPCQNNPDTTTLLREKMQNA